MAGGWWAGGVGGEGGRRKVERWQRGEGQRAGPGGKVGVSGLIPLGRQWRVLTREGPDLCF